MPVFILVLLGSACLSDQPPRDPDEGSETASDGQPAQHGPAGGGGDVASPPAPPAPGGGETPDEPNEPSQDGGAPNPELPFPSDDFAEDGFTPDPGDDDGDVEDGEPPSEDAPPEDDAPPPVEPGVPPPLPAYSHGECPQLLGGPSDAASRIDGFPTGEDHRSFRLLVPDAYHHDNSGRPWPVVFGWHWLNASAGSFLREGQLESAVAEMEFIAVLPEMARWENGTKKFLFDWPFAEEWGADAEILFFEDLMACLGANFRIDPHRIYGIGVSAGGLWISYLSSTDAGNRFAAIESLSGGLGEVPFAWRMEYTPQPHKFPAIVLWGGEGDWLGLSFHEGSQRYRDALLQDGHFVIECTHDSGHAVPPIEPPPGQTRFTSLWRFMLDHPYDTPHGWSPYLDTGLPPEFPDWCRIASPRGAG